MADRDTAGGLSQPHHSFAATNPCHVYDMARALHGLGALRTYYSGYPSWRLKPPEGFPIVSLPSRTLLTYALQRLPEWLRPADDRVFRWQDAGFDRAVSRKLTERDGVWLHGLPGQCLEIFRAAKERGTICVLNHASGPLHQQRALVEAEYSRIGWDLEAVLPFPGEWQKRLAEEVQLADRHCVASSVVKQQLIEDGVDPARILVVPYGADSGLFPKRTATPAGTFKICFAGRRSLRKGIHYLLKALKAVGRSDWELHFYGMPSRESERDLAAYRGPVSIIDHGAVSQADFGRALADMSVLVLPSVEEAFGLVIVQALAVGVPCIVSDRVGASDLIRQGETGSVTPFGEAEAIGEALLMWASRRITVADSFPWSNAAMQLLNFSAESCLNTPK